MNKFFNPEITSWSSLVQRPLYSLASVKDVVDGIFNNVELYGDKSLIDYTNKFDNVNFCLSTTTNWFGGRVICHV